MQNSHLSHCHAYYYMARYVRHCCFHCILFLFFILLKEILLITFRVLGTSVAMMEFRTRFSRMNDKMMLRTWRGCCSLNSGLVSFWMTSRRYEIDAFLFVQPIFVENCDLPEAIRKRPSTHSFRIIRNIPQNCSVCHIQLQAKCPREHKHKKLSLKNRRKKNKFHSRRLHSKRGRCQSSQQSLYGPQRMGILCTNQNCAL